MAKHADKITGTLSGFERLVFRGTLRMRAHCAGMMSYLHHVGALLKKFGAHAEAPTRQLREASAALAGQDHFAIQSGWYCSKVRKLWHPRHGLPAPPPAYATRLAYSGCRLI
jgi:hypothetical protein